MIRMCSRCNQPFSDLVAFFYAASDGTFWCQTCLNKDEEKEAKND